LKYLVGIIIAAFLSGCATETAEQSALPTTTTIGEMHLADGNLEVAISRGGHRYTQIELHAVQGISSAIVEIQAKREPGEVIGIAHVDDVRNLLVDALTLPISAEKRDVITTIGVIQSYDDSGLVLSAIQHNGELSFGMLVVGSYGIPRIHFDFTREDIKKLGRLLNEAADETEYKTSNKSSSSSSNKSKPVFGVFVINLTPSIASQLHHENMKAALVVKVSPGSISDKAGIKVGDVIYQFDGKHIEQFTDLQKAVAETAIGRKVSVKLLRGEKELSIDAQF
jgi:membrane-associated protease RseP (regulator of RpoE activity)